MYVAFVGLDKGDMVNSDFAHFCFLPEQHGSHIALIYHHP